MFYLEDDDQGLPIVRGEEAREILRRWENTPKWTFINEDDEAGGAGKLKSINCASCGATFLAKTRRRKYCDACKGVKK